MGTYHISTAIVTAGYIDHLLKLRSSTSPTEPAGPIAPLAPEHYSYVTGKTSGGTS